MTAPIAFDDFATLTGYDRRTVQRGMDVLVTYRLVRLVGGGRGRTASYELLALPGAGADPSLPLIGRAPRPPRAVPPGPTLFDPLVVNEGEKPASDVRANNVRHFVLRWSSNIGSFVLRCAANIGSFVLRLKVRAFDVRHFVLRSHPHAVDVDDARAHAVRKSDSEVHTHTAAAVEPRAHAPPCRYLGSVHAWCGGRVHVPMELHRDFLRRHGRLAGETDADLDAALVGFYERTMATLPADAWIVDNDFKFWRRAYAAAFASDTTTRGSRHDDSGETRFTRQELEDAKIIRTRAYNGCPHDPRCATFADCIRAIALARKVS